MQNLIQSVVLLALVTCSTESAEDPVQAKNSANYKFAQGTSEEEEEDVWAVREGWQFDLSLYGIAASMSGDMTVRGIPAELDLGFDSIWENLEMAGMGRARVGYNRLGASVDVVFMGLQGKQSGVTMEVDQWLVQPELEYRVCRHFDVFAGARYNSLEAEIRGTGPFGRFRSKSGTQDWWDPIIGARVDIPLLDRLRFDVRGDLGGFSIGSDLTWQVEPVLNWRFAKWGSAQVGYRWLYTDYKTGSGTSTFNYSILTQGPQIGATLHF